MPDLTFTPTHPGGRILPSLMQWQCARCRAIYTGFFTAGFYCRCCGGYVWQGEP